METTTLKNGFYNTIASVMTPLFGLVTLPYVTRILGAEGFGTATMALTTVSYFVTLSSLGISVYGVREIARHRLDYDSRSQIFSDLLVLNALAGLVGLGIYATLIFLIPTFQTHKVIYFIAGINLFFGFIQIEWLYQGMGSYRVVTVRVFLSRLFALILLFTFIRTSKDVDKYVWVMVTSLGLANLFNFLFYGRFVKFSRKGLNLRRHLGAIKIFFGTRVLSSVYTILDIVVLGLISGNYYVGLYSAAIRLTRVVVTLITSMSAVLLPKVSEQISQGRLSDYESTSQTTLYALLLTAIPGSVLIMLFAKQILNLFAGAEFGPAVITLQILSGIIIVVALSNFCGVQVLYPHGLERVVAKSLGLGAVVSITGNLLLIPVLQHNGAAIATLAAESVILCYQVYYVRYRSGIRLSLDPLRLQKIILGLSIWIVSIVGSIIVLPDESFMKLVVGLIFAFLLYVIVFYLLREPILLQLIHCGSRGQK
jgi:O-antigen/teichoic acid export membrane protein